MPINFLMIACIWALFTMFMRVLCSVTTHSLFIPIIISSSFPDTSFDLKTLWDPRLSLCVLLKWTSGSVLAIPNCLHIFGIALCPCYCTCCPFSIGKPPPCCPIWLIPKDANVCHAHITCICCSGFHCPMFKLGKPTIPTCYLDCIPTKMFPILPPWTLLKLGTWHGWYTSIIELGNATISFIPWGIVIDRLNVGGIELGLNKPSFNKRSVDKLCAWLWTTPIKFPFSLSSPTDDDWFSCAPSSKLSKTLFQIFSSSSYNIKVLIVGFDIIFFKKDFHKFQGFRSSNLCTKKQKPINFYVLHICIKS